MNKPEEPVKDYDMYDLVTDPDDELPDNLLDDVTNPLPDLGDSGGLDPDETVNILEYLKNEWCKNVPWSPGC